MLYRSLLKKEIPRVFKHKTISILLLTIVILSLSQLQLFAEYISDKSSARVRPGWIKETPKGEIFEYYVGMATSTSSLENAKDTAISDAISGLALKNEIVVEGTIKTNDTEINNTLLSSVTKDIKLYGKSNKITGLQKEEDYWEMAKINNQSGYRYWVLMRIPKHLETYNAETSVKTGYGAIPILKSVVVPGWGQIHKGEPIKGVAFLSSIAVTTTAGFIMLNLSNGYKDDAADAHDQEWVDYYNEMSDQYFYAGLSSLIIAGALYGYNVFDVISAKGAKIYAGTDKPGLNICLLPYKRNTLCFSYKF